MFTGLVIGSVGGIIVGSIYGKFVLAEASSIKAHISKEVASIRTAIAADIAAARAKL